MKFCPRCQQVLPDTAFNKRDNMLQAYCRSCNKEYQKAANQRRREARAQRRREIAKFFFV